MPNQRYPFLGYFVQSSFVPETSFHFNISDRETHMNKPAKIRLGYSKYPGVWMGNRNRKIVKNIAKSLPLI
jgi:hypothetical protein